MIDELNNLLRSVRIVDVVDVAFVSIFIYALLSWFRRTTSQSVYVGIALLALVYLLARTFDLLMTALLFQALFAVLLIALVVVFQEDLRRIFERLATWGVRRQPRRTTTFAHVDALVSAVTDLASKKVGALIVIRGHEPLDRHIEGGIIVDGQVSKPLLDSIFDPHSMGHDGAVTIEDGRIKLFAAHLPLSRNLKQVGSLGTRHSAALGLSELSDALVIIVSEERGQISIAEAGRIRATGTTAEFQQRLEDFCQRKFPEKTSPAWSRAVRQQPLLKAFSVLFACVAWYWLSYQPETVQQVFLMPVEFRNVPQNILLDAPPTQVRVTLSGRERAFELLAPSTLKVSLDLAEITEGTQQIPVQEEQVRRPPNLSVAVIEPRVLEFDAHTLVPANLEIEVRTIGGLPAGVELKSLRPDPPSIRAMVWRAERGQIKRLQTAPVDLSRISRSTTVSVPLVLPREVRFPDGRPPEVRVTIEVAPASSPRPVIKPDLSKETAR